MTIHLFALVLQLVPAGGASQDTTRLPPDSVEALVERIRSMQRAYERTAVRHAPTQFAAGGGSDRCDEHIGRFCLFYEDNYDRPDESEAAEVIRARQALIEELRRSFSLVPSDARVAGPLVRYLVQDDRAREAVSAARTFAMLSTDTTAALLLHGFALHAATRDSAAESVFDRALARMDPAERRGLERVDVLLRGDERDAYLDLDAEERRRYESAFWRIADPFFLTPGNERRAGHFARHVWARLLSRTPRARGVHRWGDDLQELTLRYGIPVQRARVLARSTVLGGEYMVSWYDPRRLAYTPRALRTEGIPPTPRLERSWRLDDPAAAAQFAPPAFRRVVRLPHAVARLPRTDRDSVRLRFDARFTVDSAAAGADSVRTGVFLLDERFDAVRELRRTVALDGDSAVWAVEVDVPPGRYVYSIEAIADTGRVAGRIRYSLPVPGYGGRGPDLSDVLLRRPFAVATGRRRAGQVDTLPPPAWRLTPHDTVGIYGLARRLAAGADGGTHYDVEIFVRRREDGAALARAARWLGRTLGLTDSPAPVRVRWEATGEARRPAVVAFNLALDGLDPGVYALRLTVTDRIRGEARTSERLVRIEEPDG